MKEKIEEWLERQQEQYSPDRTYRLIDFKKVNEHPDYSRAELDEYVAIVAETPRKGEEEQPCMSLVWLGDYNFLFEIKWLQDEACNKDEAFKIQKKMIRDRLKEIYENRKEMEKEHFLGEC